MGKTKENKLKKKAEPEEGNIIVFGR